MSYRLINADDELLFSYLTTNACRICIGDLTFVYCIIEKNHGELSSWFKLLTMIIVAVLGLQGERLLLLKLF